MNLGFKKKQCPEVKYLKGNNVRAKHDCCLLSKLLLTMKQNFFQNCTLRSICFFGEEGFCLKITLVIIILDYLFLFVKMKPKRKFKVIQKFSLGGQN